MALPPQATAHASRNAARRGRTGFPGPDGLSPAAQALAAKKPSGFLQLFRRIAGAANGTGGPAGGRKAPGEVPSGSAARSGRGIHSSGLPAEGLPSGRAARPGRETARGHEDHPAPQALSGRARKKPGIGEAEEARRPPGPGRSPARPAGPRGRARGGPPRARARAAPARYFAAGSRGAGGGGPAGAEARAGAGVRGGPAQRGRRRTRANRAAPPRPRSGPNHPASNG